MSSQSVLIVGAGPSGLILANELLRRGVGCRIIDRQTKPIESSRAFTIHSKTMEMLEHMGVAHRFLDYGIKSKGFTFTFKGETHRTELDFTKSQSRYPYITIFNQNETEKILREHLEARYGLTVEYGTSLQSLEEVDGVVNVDLTYIGNEDKKDKEQYNWVIGCDGIRSTVRQALSLPFDGEGYTDQLMQMMDTPIIGFEHTDDWVHYFMSKETFLLISRLPGNRYRILVSDRGESKATGDLTARDTFQEIFHKLGVKGEIVEPRDSTMWRIWKRQATDYRKGHIFLAGDAVHIHSPSGGQGMNACMQDTFNLGWKLAMVIKGAMKDEYLDTYQSERLPVSEQVLDGTNDMHQIIMAHGRDVSERAELTKREGWHERAVAKISGLGYTYEKNYQIPEGMTELPGPAIGSRAYDVSLHERQRLFELMGHPRMTMIVMKHKGDDKASEELLETIAQDYGSAVKGYIVQPEDVYGLNQTVYYQDDSGELFKEYGDAEQSSILLLRPDGYIGFRCLLSEKDYLLKNLESFLIPVSQSS